MSHSLLSDPGFDDSSAWRFAVLIGGTAAVFNGKLTVDNVGSVTVYADPNVQAIIGKDYNYKIIVNSVSGAGSATVLFGEEIVWDHFRGAGTFTGKIKASQAFALRITGSNISFEFDYLTLEEPIIRNSELRAGFRNILLGMNNPDLPAEENIAWQNRGYKPTPGTPWLRETLLPGAERLVANSLMQGVGIMQYDVLWPANQGTEEAEDLADDIKATFAPFTRVTSGAQSFRAEVLPAIQDEKWYQVPVRITYRVFDYIENIVSAPPTVTLLDERGENLLDETSEAILEG
jgi:hypothetical protein